MEKFNLNNYEQAEKYLKFYTKFHNINMPKEIESDINILVKIANTLYYNTEIALKNLKK